MDYLRNELIGCKDKDVAKKIQKVFSLPWFRTYTSDDVAGIELGGAAKNIYAICAGISDGLGLGDNAKSALVTRGLAEMIRLGTALGGKAETFQGLSGVGDLIVTCYSSYSRNNKVGRLLGEGKAINEILGSMNMVAEGVPNTISFYESTKKQGVNTPIIDQAYEMIENEKSPKSALEDLLSRDLRPETFKIRAYKTGSEIIENFSGDIEQIAKDEKLDEIKGIGKALASKIQEIINTGRLSYYENLKSEFPDSIFELFDVSNLGPKKIKHLYDTLKVDSIEKLESSCKSGEISKLSG